MLRKHLLLQCGPSKTFASPLGTTKMEVSPANACLSFKRTPNMTYPCQRAHHDRLQDMQSVAVPVLLQEIGQGRIHAYLKSHEHPAKASHYTVPALCTDFPHMSGLTPGDWTPMVHPEGALYFYHKEKRIYTEVYIYEPNHREEVEVFAQYLEDFLHSMDMSPPSDDCELVLEVSFSKEEGDSIVWSYYYVDHRTKTLFWLRPFVADHIMTEILGFSSPDHFNMMTSNTSTSPYSVDDLQRMITFVKRGRNPGAGAIFMSCAIGEYERYAQNHCIIPHLLSGRLMSTFSHYRYINFHGQRGARLNRDQSLHGPLHAPRTWLMNSFSPLLFLAPNVHLKEIEKVIVDGMVVMSVWKQHLTKLQNEWTEFVLYATVLLNANVAFLSIPNVIIFPDNNGTGGNNAQPFQKPLRSPAAIASYFSMITSVGSVIIGLLLLRQTRLKHRDDATQAVEYMYKVETRWFGREPLAIIYSLPYALLMWAMISFLVGVMIFCFKDTDVVTRGSVSAIVVAVSGLIAWCIFSAWETRHEGPLDIVDHAAGSLRELRQRLITTIPRFGTGLTDR
ncbi:hypothetical protein OF83DRAFT_392027 [Amylostereum chailletii]|nr:hypothetical protein OF83DRAFT_392027 [Amylostereum chailletii]